MKAGGYEKTFHDDVIYERRQIEMKIKSTFNTSSTFCYDIFKKHLIFINFQFWIYFLENGISRCYTFP